jgi:hypothetical protein
MDKLIGCFSFYFNVLKILPPDLLSLQRVLP